MRYATPSDCRTLDLHGIRPNPADPGLMVGAVRLQDRHGNREALVYAGWANDEPCVGVRCDDAEWSQVMPDLQAHHLKTWIGILERLGTVTQAELLALGFILS